jgi:hypothetical protein
MARARGPSAKLMCILGQIEGFFDRLDGQGLWRGIWEAQ